MLGRLRTGVAAVAVPHRIEGFDAAFRVPEDVDERNLINIRALPESKIYPRRLARSKKCLERVNTVQDLRPKR